MRREVIPLFIGALLATLTGACGDAARPDLLLISVDTLRPDYLSMNGYDRATTPKLDALLAQGVYFDQAISPVPRTTPALASLLTGAYPHTTGVRTLTDPLDQNVTTLTEILRNDGYQTIAVVSNQVLIRDRGLARGFDTYDMAADDRNAKVTTDVALGYFEQLDPSDPTFAWIHYIDPHVPYHADAAIASRMDPGYTGRYRFHFGWTRQPGEPRDRHSPFPADLPKREATHRNSLPSDVNAHIRRLYAADIRSVDDQIGRLVRDARSRFGDDLIVVLTSDHGESLGEHDFYFDHGDYVYNAGTRVPLAIVLPASHPLHHTGRCSNWVSLTDVAPTLLELLGRNTSELGDQLEGRSLLACLRGKALEDVPVFAESGRSYFIDDVRGRKRNDVAGRFRAVTEGDWKLIWTPFQSEDASWQLYNVTDDPDESNDLFRPDHPRFVPLRDRLDTWLARQPATNAQPSLSEQDLNTLRELGYIDTD